jgi:hypothetical protein
MRPAVREPKPVPPAARGGLGNGPRGPRYPAVRTGATAFMSSGTRCSRRRSSPTPTTTVMRRARAKT